MNIPHHKLKAWFVEPGHVREKDFDAAAKKAKEEHIPLQDLLVEQGLISDEHMGRTVADGLGIKFMDVNREKIDEGLFSLIPHPVIRSRGVIPFRRTEEGIAVGMVNPHDMETRHFLEKRFGGEITPYYVTVQGFKNVLAKYQTTFHKMLVQSVEQLQKGNLEKNDRDREIVNLVDTLLQYGFDSKASDIHIEPYEKKVVVRFRIDGILHQVFEIPKELLELILSRIKILAKMRTDEHRSAQDGKLRFKAKSSFEGKNQPSDNGEVIDIRVSVIPVTQGENIVLRLLSSHGRQFLLEDLGFDRSELGKVKRAIEKPHGMFLVTGPTGSGKTTTVYAVLKILNSPEVNVATIEDPVEYDIEGVSQIQVHPKMGLTFAKGLRAIVRQDPDIIMVGEIRDEETAGIAINSAMTGHLVLSTLHANDAATTLPRLLDMKIEPFLVASTVNIVIGQRLVRKICVKCRASYTLSDEEKKLIEREKSIKEYLAKRGYGDLKKVTFFKGEGTACNVCNHTGYAGRVGIFEVLEVTDAIKDLILKRASSGELVEVAHKEGMRTMLEDGIEKVLQGITTLEEVVRVIKA